MLRNILIASTFAFFWGCGSSGPPKATLYPVTGKVTVKGQPLADCRIILVTNNPGPNAAPGYSSDLSASGEYSLEDPQDHRKGAAPGKYKVTFTLMPEAAKKAMMEGMSKNRKNYQATAAQFPPEYSSAEKSPKEVEVKSEPNVINIEL